MVVERVRQMSVADFLDFAESSEDRYEYIDGEPYKMTGGTLNHFEIISNIVFELRLLLADTDCRTLPNGMLIRSGDTSLLSPDVIVVCGEPETESETRILLNPILVAEVTSPSSIDYDRGSKRRFYSDLPSIAAYLVIDQHRPLVELYTRAETGWHIQCFDDLEEAVPLEALDCRLPLSEIYASIDFDAETSASANEAE